MAKQRYVNTKMWRDNYFQNLDPSEKLLFIYFLTNPDTNICGIYELPIKIISADTGFTIQIIEEILRRFEKDNKIIYKKGWVIIKNFVKHQNIRSPKIQAGITAEMLKVPENIKRYGIDTLSHFNTNTNLNTNSNTNKKDNKEILILLKYWLECGLTQHKESTVLGELKAKHFTNVDRLGLKELQTAIDNYIYVLNSDKYYYSHKFPFWDFIGHGYSKFLDECQPRDNFKVSLTEKQVEEEKEAKRKAEKKKEYEAEGLA